MSFSKAQDASPDARAFMQACVDNAFGVKVSFGEVGANFKKCPHCNADNVNRNAAWNFRQRCFNVRAKDREMNSRIYSPGEPMHNKSTFDSLTLFIHDEPDGRCSIVGVTNLEGLAQVSQITILKEAPSV